MSTSPQRILDRDISIAAPFDYKGILKTEGNTLKRKFGEPAAAPALPRWPGPRRRPRQPRQARITEGEATQERGLKKLTKIVSV
jgi:hypothetical protein